MALNEPWHTSLCGFGYPAGSLPHTCVVAEQQHYSGYRPILQRDDRPERVCNRARDARVYCLKRVTPETACPTFL